MKTSVLAHFFGFCILLLFIRILKTGHFSFLFLIWNLFLAWVPYKLIQLYDRFQKVSIQLILLASTILFLPNAPYIITDLFHLTKTLAAPMWFDLTLILSFSLMGLVFFMLAIEHLFSILRVIFVSDTWFKIIKGLILVSNGYGIYLGRYLRFNSWDLITHPNQLFRQMYKSVFDEDSAKETISVTLTFTIFLYLVVEIYESLKKKAEGVQNELF